MSLRGMSVSTNDVATFCFVLVDRHAESLAMTKGWWIATLLVVENIVDSLGGFVVEGVTVEVTSLFGDEFLVRPDLVGVRK